MDAFPNGVPDLSGTATVRVTDWRVIGAASVELLPGGIPGMQGELTLRVVDIANECAYLIPVGYLAARKLSEAWAHLADVVEQSQQ